MSDALLLCNYTRAGISIPAATPTVIDVPIDGAADWNVVLTNAGPNPVTALSVAVSPLGARFSAAASVTDGIPLAAGASLASILGARQPCKTLRLTVTSTLGTTVGVEAVGK